ncbi:hypothetical protein [Flavobacterium daejeonense]|uniref:hypothetical protein n=1 Tax=Flavobacterium daejeonense TaxID=350893 RepID=UPI000558BE54|nr:hypothetical protein [Flavobacterium daejeonense]
MKKRVLIITLLFVGGVKGFSQTVYVDVLTAPAMIAYSNTLKTEQNKTNTNLSNIQKGQALVASQLKVANDLHDKVLKGLTQVSQTLNNALTIKEIYSTSVDIINDTKQTIDLAAGNPVLTVFAVNSAKTFKERAVLMTAEISRILASGETNMMDAGERQKLLNYIHTEIRLLGANVYMMKESMYWAKMNGIWNTLNPFRAWINQDEMIIKSVMQRSKQI